MSDNLPNTLMESIGAICPNCSYAKMLHQYGDKEYLQFDACPKCGFGKAVAPTQEKTITGEVTGVVIINGKELW